MNLKGCERKINVAKHCTCVTIFDKHTISIKFGGRMEPKGCKREYDAVIQRPYITDFDKYTATAGSIM